MHMAKESIAGQAMRENYEKGKASAKKTQAAMDKIGKPVAKFTRNRVGDEVRSKKRGSSNGYMTGGKN